MRLKGFVVLSFEVSSAPPMDRLTAYRRRRALEKNRSRVLPRLRPPLPCGCRDAAHVYGQAVVRVTEIRCRAHRDADADPYAGEMAAR